MTPASALQVHAIYVSTYFGCTVFSSNSSRSTPIWTRPASFERADTDLSNAVRLVQLGVDDSKGSTSVHSVGLCLI